MSHFLFMHILRVCFPLELKHLTINLRRFFNEKMFCFLSLLNLHIK